MSSRGNGSRAEGTDGSDHLHRETVANHYKISATNKWRLKAVTFIHISLWMVMMFRMSTPLYVLFGVRPPQFLQRLKLPKAELWEYMWTFSLLPSILSLIALKRNRHFLMQQSLLGIIVFGILPMIFGLYALLDDLLEYWDTRTSKRLLFGFPVVVLWNMFLAINFQVHAFALYFGWQLYNAWKPKGSKKVN